ncbi:DUF2269 domain-containing protein [Lysobacter sp.]|uniref:DUF2269 family protein n=1 Tax=Lysobacter sp. TaxID=72226 RepID=UPI002D72D4EA|nr:DUF2269 domain-containing protein [Lysobacter sp.]HZX77723.1 DUF2269 domain-containing protein [Lysobacter sp.]
MEYFVVKWLHILSSTLLFGTGIGTAFYLFFISRSDDVRTIAAVARLVVIADWCFTATSIVVQPVTGFYLARLMGIPLDAPWLAWSIGLFAVAAACWLPVVWLQMRMRDIAVAAARAGEPLPPSYRRNFRAWTALGFPALFSLLAVFYLMVAKPNLGS